MKKRMSALLLLLVVACQREIPLQKQSVVMPLAELPKPAFSYYEGTHAVDAVQQVRAKVGEPFRVLDIRIFDDEVVLEVQDPKKKENVDQYRVDGGKLKDPKPVRLIGQSDQETLDANVFDPADVDLTRIAALITEANEKVQLDGREMTGVGIKRDMFDDKRPVMIDVNYMGSRKHGYLRADRKGAHSKIRVF